MAGRFLGAVPKFNGPWSDRIGRELTEFLARVAGAVNSSQGTAATPATIQAGAAAAVGTSNAMSSATHVHAVETAAPSVAVALGGSPSEGTGTSLMRADAGLVLAAGGDAGDALRWNGTSWESSDEAETLEWIL